MNMADNELAQVAKLITDSESRIIKVVDDKVTALEKNMTAQIQPIIKEQDKHAIKIENIYDKYFLMDAKSTNLDTKIREQGKRFGERLDDIEEKNRESSNGKRKIKYLIIGSILSIFASIILIYVGKIIR